MQFNSSNASQSTYIVSNDLREYCGSQKQLNELASLLSNWHLGDLFDFFREQQLYPAILKQLSNERVRNLLENSQFTLGVREQFYYEWSRWNKLCVEITPNDQHRSSQTDANESICSHTETLQRITIDLNEILIYATNFHGDKFLKATYLDERLRKELCDAILKYCIKNDHEISVKDSESLAYQICDKFPDEDMDYYYKKMQRGAPRGKLYYMYRNWKSKGCGNKRKLNDNTVDGSKKVKAHSTLVTDDEITQNEGIQPMNVVSIPGLPEDEFEVSKHLRSYSIAIKRETSEASEFDVSDDYDI